MPRLLAFLLAAAALAVHAPAPGQGTGARDAVTYFDRKEGKLATLTDALVKKETSAGIDVLVGGETRSIPSPDLVRVDYGNLPGVSASDLIVLRQIEEADDLAKLQAKYADLAKKAGAGSARTKRVLAFREAATAVKAADRRADPDEFRPDALRAVKLLTEFGKQFDKGWEVWPAARTAARMQMELGDFAGAAAILGRLARVADLTPDQRFDARLAEAGATLRADNGPAAAAVLDELGKDPNFPGTGPLRQKWAVLSAAAKLPKPPAGAAPSKPAGAAALEKAIADAPDPGARAVGYGLLGDLLRAHGQPRDAAWAYLWVDVVYPEDRSERVVALLRLAESFDALGDPDRAARFRDKLASAR